MTRDDPRPDPKLVVGLADLFGLRCFVETGTLHGDTSLWAAEHFDRVVTIEASRPYFTRVQQRFSGIAKITSLHGDSGEKLAGIVPSLPPSLFFLDAHWCGGESAGQDHECPLLTELALILPWLRKHIVLIDDARLFLRPPPPPHKRSHWPSLDEILQISAGLTYIVEYQDLLIVAPSVHRDTLATFVHGLLYAGDSQ